jgi:hypothetical protein
MYLYPIAVLIIGIFAYIGLENFTEINVKFLIMVACIIVFIFGTVLYIYSSRISTTLATLSYIMSGIITFAVIIGLAIFFYFYSNYLKTHDGWGGFFVSILFYVPCLVLDCIEYLKSEIGLTSNVVYYLFLLELFAALSYIYVPKIFNKINDIEGTQLLGEPAFLDIKKEIGSGYNLALQNTGYNENASVTYKRSYSISMWVYLNLQPPNYSSYAKEAEIFNYGNGLPKITYINNVDTDGSKKPDVLRIYFTNKGSIADRSYTVNIPTQKWNQIVCNYTSSQVDLFINGHLEKTILFNKNLPDYSAEDIISVGTTDGLDGAICNIKYHALPLSKRQVANSYNLLMKQNPPVNIL